MKLKDIKKQLNKETDENTPDVLDNVKVSPINKLKKNEKSMTVFKKTMATLILVFLLAILVVLSIAIHGLVSQDDGKIDNFTFLSIRIYDGTDQNGLDSDDLKIYNLILDDNGKILLVYDQNTNENLQHLATLRTSPTSLTARAGQQYTLLAQVMDLPTHDNLQEVLRT